MVPEVTTSRHACIRACASVLLPHCPLCHCGLAATRVFPPPLKQTWELINLADIWPCRGGVSISCPLFPVALETSPGQNRSARQSLLSLGINAESNTLLVELNHLPFGNNKLVTVSAKSPGCGRSAFRSPAPPAHAGM